MVRFTDPDEQNNEEIAEIDEFEDEGYTESENEYIT
jgi:hypothetical protein